MPQLGRNEEIAFVHFNRLFMRLTICCTMAIIFYPSVQARFYFQEKVIRNYSICLHFDMREKMHILLRNSCIWLKVKSIDAFFYDSRVDVWIHVRSLVLAFNTNSFLQMVSPFMSVFL